jgi:hypothetical protein
MIKRKILFLITVAIIISFIGCDTRSDKVENNKPSVETVTRWNSSFWYNSPAKQWS